MKEVLGSQKRSEARGVDVAETATPGTGGRYPRALLEDWMRDYYFDVDLDIGGSGVEDFSLRELRQLLGLRLEDIDEVVFHDSRSFGGDNLRAALAERYTGGRTERVMATHGSTEATFLVMNALLDQGDEVIVATPSYQQLASTAEPIGCRLVRWPLRFEDGFRPDLDELRRLITSRTRMVVANFPHNPTGATVTPEEQRELIEAVSRAGAWLLWDNAFQTLTFAAPPLPEPTELYERAVSICTLSKAFGLPGLRVGWVLAASPAVLEAMVHVRDYLTLSLSPLVELVAERAIRGADVLLDMRHAQAKRNLEMVTAWAEERRDRLTWVAPQGGVTAFPRLPTVSDVDAFCHRLGKERRVLLAPGSCFGLQGHVRLGFGGGTEGLRKGLGHLSDMLAETL